MVEPVDKAYVRNFFGGENVLACAYVLFYQETTEEAMMKEQEAEGLAAAKQASELNQEVVTTPKANGTSNGYHHPLYTAQTPTVEEEDQFASLNHATAPALAHVQTQSDHQPVEHVTTNVPVLGAKKSNLKLFGKSNKEDKERKAAEKELQKEAEKKRREMETQRRENYRRQEEELRAVLAASRESAALEEKKRVNGENTDPSHAAGSDTKGANGFNSSKGVSGLSRFRHSSMSLKGKPKFWSGGKDKEKHESADDTSHAESDDKGDEKDGKEKNRFSLGRKKSTFKF
jgi:ubiquitin carboxyl-terminal hydrolase 9/13